MSDRPLPVLSFTMDTSQGGIPLTLCGCGVLLLRTKMAWGHIDLCPTMAEWRAEHPEGDTPT